jgi:competence protein ComEC
MRKDQILFVACLLYISGVFVGSFFVVAGWTIFLLGALCLTFSLVLSRQHIFLLVFFFAVFVTGIFSITHSLEQFREGNMRESEVSGIARVANDPEEKSFYRSVVLRLESCDSAYCPREKILWQAPLITEMTFGTRVNLICALKLPENFDAAFDYRMFLAKDGIGYVCRRAESVRVLPEDTVARWGKFFFTPKHALAAALNETLAQPEAGLAEGLLLGGDNHLSTMLKQSFIKAGLSHIVAISGYNIFLIAQGFVLLGIGIGLWRKQALCMAALGIVLFILLIGSPASAVRAGIMGLCVFAALFVGRLAQPLNMLLGAAVAMLIFQPLLLRYDVGFQLSFLATLAIVVVLPFLGRLFTEEFFGKSLVEIALMTLAVELFVVPLIVYQFHIFSPFALLANVLILPLVPYAMALSFAAGMTFFVWPGLSILPSAAAYFFLRIITFVVEEINVWPGAQMAVSVGGAALFLWYTGLFLVIVIMKRYLERRYVQAKNLF